MNIRKKITLWISGTVVLSTIIFSSFVFFEMLEQSFLLIDKELNNMALALVSEMKKSGRDRGAYDFSHMTLSPDNYWIRVIDHAGKTLYQSKITEFTDILPGGKNTYMVEKRIPRDKIWLEQDDNDDVFFRVKVIEAEIDGSKADVHIAKPIEKIEKELKEL